MYNYVYACTLFSIEAATQIQFCVVLFWFCLAVLDCFVLVIMLLEVFMFESFCLYSYICMHGPRVYVECTVYINHSFSTLGVLMSVLKIMMHFGVRLASILPKQTYFHD